MPLYEMTGDQLRPVPERTFTELGVLERDTQRAIRANIEAITPGVKTMVLAEEFNDWDGSGRRIDLLCLDSEGKIVVVELKRDKGVHMELQALRYAAMISTMRFDQAVEAHRRFLRSSGSQEDAEQRIRKHLGIGDAPGALSETVRIVLASREFPTELTTTALWLNKQGLDLRCVEMIPRELDGRVLLDIQQVIPLPSAAQYQVAVREKSNEQAVARTAAGRDLTRYDLTIGDVTLTNLFKKRLVYEIVAEAIRRQDLTPEMIASAVPWRENGMFLSAPGRLDPMALQAALPDRPLDSRYFADPEELFFSGGATYALSDQWGDKTLDAVELIVALLPNSASIDIVPTTPIDDEVVFKDWVIRRRETGTIEIEHDGQAVQPAIKVLREIASQLGVPLKNGRGGHMNTRQLGAQVIQAVRRVPGS